MSKDKLSAIFEKRKAQEAKKATESNKSVVKDLTPFIERFSQKQLDEWKKLYGDRELIYLKVDSFLAVLRPPVADDLGDYLTAFGTNGMTKAVSMIVEQLWLDGDFELIEDEDNFIAVFLQMNNILESKKADFFRA